MRASAYTGAMRLWIAAIGSRPRAAFDDLAQMYLERIGTMLPGGVRKSTVEAPLFRTEEAFWVAVERESTRTVPLLVLLDERGRQIGSEDFAAWLGRERDQGHPWIVFAVGPADGWTRTQPGDRGSGSRPMLLSLGPMTLPHELARVVICEQIYRALTILKGHPYHRAR